MKKTPYHGRHGQRWQRGKRWDGRKWVAINHPTTHSEPDYAGRKPAFKGKRGG